jgi:hypothetical protein
MYIFISKISEGHQLLTFLFQGAHTAGFNSVGYGVCLMGNFMDHEPTEAALQVHMTFGGCPPGLGKAILYMNKGSSPGTEAAL